MRWYDQIEGLRMVRDSTSIPVNAGQGELTAFGCRDLVIGKAVDILNVDVTVAGGVTEWRRIAAMAGAFHVQMAHHEEPQIAVHLLAVCPSCPGVFAGVIAVRGGGPVRRRGVKPSNF